MFLTGSPFFSIKNRIFILNNFLETPYIAVLVAQDEKSADEKSWDEMSEDEMSTDKMSAIHYHQMPFLA
jgi:hypothetical protein